MSFSLSTPRAAHVAGVGLAVLAVLAPTAASAQAAPSSQVTIYGYAAVEVIRASNVFTGASSGSLFRVDNSPVTSSRLGFRGSEDLGGGLAAIFDMTHGIALDTGAQASGTKFWNRGSWVGLRSGTLGSVTIGRHWNVNDDIMGRYFVFGGYSAFRFSEFGFISDLVDNSVKYVTPNFSGFQARALVGAGEGTTGRTVELGANYENGPLSVGATVRRAKNAAGATDKLDSLGASYAFGPVRVHAGWSNADLQASALPKARAWDLGVEWRSDQAIVAQLDYVVRDQSGTNNDSKFIRLQADYFLSKRTALFGNLIKLTNDGTANQRFFGSGGAGQSQSVLSLGMRHAF